MQFIPLDSAQQLAKIKQSPAPVVIFKHNTTCPISKGVHRGLEQDGSELGNTPVYLLDLMAHRDLSDAVAEQFQIPHESPQILVIKNGGCTYSESMLHISAAATAEALQD
ncbi:bacillithiol system redox-active protein YtxJ [Paracnuella aquatica]|nr:bacillithiol system redox-active protein YtxJ [Paracnuella aquatica]RPD48125.1 bacillithiol system redox-active protein YtxJ [Paracnuella aquatica]